MRAWALTLGALLALSGTASWAQDNPTVKAGKYVVEFRVPEEGVFAQEEIDIEFRLMDSTMNDEILGMAGVPNASVKATTTMPEMPGMPEAKPPIHTEGVPGDYGVTFFFPHGGKYQVDLKITPPGGQEFLAKFDLNVKDERATKGGKRVLPYRLDLNNGSPAKAGQPFPLKLQIKDSKSGETVKAFDIAHEKYFHLLIASKDFEWFLHEHPVMEPDGTWVINVAFPAEGEYLVYGDVAPVGKGSMILMNKLKVSGKKPTWKVNWTANKGPVTDGTITATLGGDIQIGRMSQLVFDLKDATTGQPVTQLEQYLGAHGHLMIFSQDGMTTVHSHPASGKATDDLLAQGKVAFNARIPKAGKYRAFAQFQRDGKIMTFKFTLDVK